MWQRFNTTSHKFESSIDNGASWVPLLIDASSITGALGRGNLPVAIAYEDEANVYTQSNTYNSSVGFNSIVGFGSSVDFGVNPSISNTGPGYQLREINAAVDKKNWLFYIASEYLRWTTLADNQGGLAQIFYSDRLGNAAFAGILTGSAGISTSGVVTGGTLSIAGAATIGGLLTCNGQIAFPNVQVPSAGPNVLDDYEEYVWAPTDVSGAGLTFVTSIGSYVKIGRMMMITYEVQYPATANAAIARIGNFPYVCGPKHGALAIGYCTQPTVTRCLVRQNTNYSEPFNGAANATNANLSGHTIIVCGVYDAVN